MTTTAEQVDAARELLARWRQGDAGARDIMLARIHPTLYRWALAWSRDADEAEDIAQQALIAVHDHVGQYRGDAPLGVWLYRITTRAAAQRLRSRKRRERLRLDPRAEPDRVVYVTDPGGRVDQESLRTLMLSVHASLPPQQRAVFQLVDLEGWSHAEAAEMMNLSAVTLRANLFKARSAMRRRLIATVPELAERFAEVLKRGESSDA